MRSLILPATSYELKSITVLFFYKEGFVIKKLTNVNMLLDKEIKLIVGVPSLSQIDLFEIMKCLTVYND